MKTHKRKKNLNVVIVNSYLSRDPSHQQGTEIKDIPWSSAAFCFISTLYQKKRWGGGEKCGYDQYRELLAEIFGNTMLWYNDVDPIYYN